MVDQDIQPEPDVFSLTQKIWKLQYLNLIKPNTLENSKPHVKNCSIILITFCALNPISVKLNPKNSKKLIHHYKIHYLYFIAIVSAIFALQIGIISLKWIVFSKNTK